jgi:transposase InsO family protein
MPYTKNPHMPKVRRDAADMVRRGYTPTEVGRRFGVGSSTICKWVKKARVYGLHPIPTRSSKPKHHPKEISRETADLIVAKRLKRNQCAEVVHAQLAREGVTTSLSSVKRTIERRGLLKKRSPWKRYHAPVERPRVTHAGALVELDTVHTMTGLKSRMYTFTLIDVYSRWVYAKSYEKMNAATSIKFVTEAQKYAPFAFVMLQTDHGPEFGKWFRERSGYTHRFTRLGKPNDNAHIERFNRTLQEECLDQEDRTPAAFNKALKKYLRWYNAERLHLGLNLVSPLQYLTECVQGID